MFLNPLKSFTMIRKIMFQPRIIYSRIKSIFDSAGCSLVFRIQLQETKEKRIRE